MNTRSSVLMSCILMGACTHEPTNQPRIAGDATQGQAILRHYECGVCHVIPGVPGARGNIGPSLAAYRRNVYVAGKFPNTPGHLIEWIVNPPLLAPDTAMPAIGVSESEARNVAAYLYTLK